MIQSRTILILQFLNNLFGNAHLSKLLVFLLVVISGIHTTEW